MACPPGRPAPGTGEESPLPTRAELGGAGSLSRTDLVVVVSGGGPDPCASLHGECGPRGGGGVFVAERGGTGKGRGGST